jgi:hypothetical protein
MGPESITTIALAACRIREEEGALASPLVRANGPRAKRAVSMDSGLVLRTPRNDEESYVLLPAACATTGSTSSCVSAARSGVSSFQRTEPNGRSSMRRTRTGSGPRWKAIAL